MTFNLDLPGKHRCSPEHAAKFRNWLATRGGLLIWKSVNLSNPGASWTTPALTDDGKPYAKPTWQAESTASRHITSDADVEVIVPREVKRFHVAVRAGNNRMSLKVTDGGSRKIRAAVDAAGEGAYYQFDGQDVVILAPDKVVPLPQWNNQIKETS